MLLFPAKKMKKREMTLYALYFEALNYTCHALVYKMEYFFFALLMSQENAGNGSSGFRKR